MLIRLLLIGLVIWSSLAPCGWADEFALEPRGYFDALPSDAINVAREDLGHDIIIGGDYGLGNHTPVEMVRRGPIKEAYSGPAHFPEAPGLCAGFAGRCQRRVRLD
jgi:hypothetical protein